MTQLKNPEDSLIQMKMAEIVDKSGYLKPRETEDVGFVNTCTCDRLLKVPNSEIDQASTLLKYTVPFKVNKNLRQGDIKEPVPPELGPEDPLLTDGSLETQEVLDCIKEPRYWEKDGELWMQVVSPSTSKRNDIFQLEREFSKEIWTMHARPRGVCRIRFALFCELFDELTRQVTVIRAERGLFLVRIRSELMDTIQTYHCMWRDTMEYFEPIIEKCIEVLAKLKTEVAELEKSIEEIQQETEEVQWKIHLLELDRAYERKSMLDWYECKIHEERIKMQQLETLLAVSTSNEIDISNPSVVSAEEYKVSTSGKKNSIEMEIINPLELSDILKDLITERKVAEGRMETKKLLENEIIWVKGEISKNKAFVTDLLRLREPLNFDDWLDAWLQGEDHPGLSLGLEDGFANEFVRSEGGSAQSLDDAFAAEFNANINLTLKKWMETKNMFKCSCDVQRGTHDEKCTKFDFELVKFHAMVEYLKTYDDSPHTKFNEFFRSYVKTTKIKDVPMLMNYVRNEYCPSPSRRSEQGFAEQGRELEVEEAALEEEESTVKPKETLKIVFSSVRDALTLRSAQMKKRK